MKAMDNSWNIIYKTHKLAAWTKAVIMEKKGEYPHFPPISKCTYCTSTLDIMYTLASGG